MDEKERKNICIQVAPGRLGGPDVWCLNCPLYDGKNGKERWISGVHIAPDMMGRIGRKGGYLVFKLPLI